MDRNNSIFISSIASQSNETFSPYIFENFQLAQDEQTSPTIESTFMKFSKESNILTLARVLNFFSTVRRVENITHSSTFIFRYKEDLRNFILEIIR